MTLKIEAGRFYRMRNGGKAGPMEWLPDVSKPDVYPWEAHYEENKRLGRDVWTIDGYGFEDKDEHPRDLVAEWVDEPAPEAPAAKPDLSSPKISLSGYVEAAEWDEELIDKLRRALPGTATPCPVGVNFGRFLDHVAEANRRTAEEKKAVVTAPASLTKRDVLDKAIEAVADRGLNYGKPEDNFRRIAALWNAHLVNRHGDKFGGDTVTALPTLDAEDVAMMMALMKLARLQHTPHHLDSIVDLAGYAACLGEIAGGA